MDELPIERESSSVRILCAIAGETESAELEELLSRAGEKPLPIAGSDGGGGGGGSGLVGQSICRSGGSARICVLSSEHILLVL